MSDTATVAEKKREMPKPTITYGYKKLTEQDKANHLKQMPNSTLFAHDPERGIFAREYAILVFIGGSAKGNIVQFATTEREAAAKVKELNGDVHSTNDPAVGDTGGDAS